MNASTESEVLRWFEAALEHPPARREAWLQAHVAQMLALIGQLVRNGLAYPAPNGDVYYSVRAFPAYGRLSGKSLDELRAGERVDIDPNKRDPMDFVLWKAAKPGPYVKRRSGKINAAAGTVRRQGMADCVLS